MLGKHNKIFSSKVYYMKKFLTYFFITLGIIFFVILIALAYLWFADPFGIRPLIRAFTEPTPAYQTESIDGNTSTQESVTNKSTVADKNPILTSEQESALESIGINPESLPTTITPEMETCFTATLGAPRVSEIKAGAIPTPIEVLKTKECY
jgi:hypothetical protein